MQENEQELNRIDDEIERKEAVLNGCQKLVKKSEKNIQSKQKLILELTLVRFILTTSLFQILHFKSIKELVELKKKDNILSY